MVAATLLIAYSVLGELEMGYDSQQGSEALRMHGGNFTSHYRLNSLYGVGAGIINLSVSN